MRKCLLGLLSVTSLFAQVELLHLSDRVAIHINGQPFGALYFGQEAHKPFLSPLTTASGKRVTRSFPLEHEDGEPTDHPHQKGLWIGAERVSGMDFWENDRKCDRDSRWLDRWQHGERTYEGGTSS